MSRRHVLRGGLVLLHEESHALPLVDIEIVLRSGCEQDPAELEGLTRLMLQLCRTGTRGLSRAETDAALDAMGGTLAISVGHSVARIYGTVIRRHLDPYLRLLGSLLTRPALRAGDFEKLVRKSKAERVGLRDHDRSLCRRAYRGHLFGDHPYGRSALGTEASLSGIRRADVLESHRRRLVTGNLAIGVAGAVTEEELLPLIEAAFKKLPEGKTETSRVPAPRRRKGRRALIVDKPGRSQSQLYIGTLGISLTDRCYFPLVVANTSFGGTFTSTLVKEVRSERGFSYGVSSRFTPDRKRDAWTMHTHPAVEHLGECAALQIGLMERWLREGVEGEALNFAKGFLKKSRAFDEDTSSKRLDMAMEREVYGLSESHGEGFRGAIDRVDAGSVRAAQEARLSAEDLSIVVVAPEAEAQAQIEQIPNLSRIERISFDEI